MRLERYCTCGKVLDVTIDRRDKAQRLAVWYAEHDGPSHQDTTAAEAERIRMGLGQAMGREAAKERER